jgi:AcrR family transcriptional regulator
VERFPAPSRRAPPRGRRQQTKARNRAAILAAARRVFAELGVEAASVRDIVRASDLGVGTFYEYFRDKQAVFDAVLEEALAGLRARLRSERRDPEQPFAVRVERAYLAFFEFVVEERGLFAVLERNVWQLGSEAQAKNLELALAELREDLLADLAEDPATAAASDYLSAAMIGAGLMVARRMLARRRPDPCEAARFCTQFSLAGVEPRRRQRRRAS